MMHSSIKRALSKKLNQQDGGEENNAHETPPQRYLPRLELSKIGRTEPICPHCNAALETMPATTAYCPHCRNEILVMTRPKDKATVLVNETEASQLHEEWQAYHERRDPYLREKGAHAINLEYSALWDKLGREPTIAEIKTSFLSKDADEGIGSE